MTDPYTFPYIDQPIEPPSPEEMARRISRAHALRQWHSDPSTRAPFARGKSWDDYEAMRAAIAKRSAIAKAKAEERELDEGRS